MMCTPHYQIAARLPTHSSGQETVKCNFDNSRTLSYYSALESRQGQAPKLAFGPYQEPLATQVIPLREPRYCLLTIFALSGYYKV